MKTKKRPLMLFCFCTPAELERIAATMRKRWAKSMAGDDLTCGVSVGDDTEIEFVIDQERMRKECGEAGSEAS